MPLVLLVMIAVDFVVTAAVAAADVAVAPSAAEWGVSRFGMPAGRRLREVQEDRGDHRCFRFAVFVCHIA